MVKSTVSRVLGWALLVGMLSTGCLGLSQERWSSIGATYPIGTPQDKSQYQITGISHNDRPYFILIFESQHGEWQSSGEGRWKGTGSFFTPDKQPVQWTCDTRDGKTGTVKIGEETFEMANGIVFLVKFQDGETLIKQVALDVPKFQEETTQVHLNQVIMADQTITAFFQTPGLYEN